MKAIEKINFEYPAWATFNNLRKFFDVGHKELQEWREKGLVLVRSKATSVLYRCKDIDRVLTEQAKGRTPLRAK